MAQEDGDAAPDVVAADAREAARELLSHVDVVNIAPVAIAANVNDEHIDVEPDRVGVAVEISVRGAPGLMENRFRYMIELLAGDETAVATLDFTLQVEYSVEPADYEPQPDAARYVAETTGMFGCYPYARELAQSLTMRLQYDPVVLGLMPWGAAQPQGVASVRRRRGATQD